VILPLTLFLSLPLLIALLGLSLVPNLVLRPVLPAVFPPVLPSVRLSLAVVLILCLRRDSFLALRLLLATAIWAIMTTKYHTLRAMPVGWHDNPTYSIRILASVFAAYGLLLMVHPREADTLPPHRSYDHKIESIPGSKAPVSRNRPLTPMELRVLKRWLDDNLAKGFIRSSKSSAASPVLLAQKSGGGVRIRVDYRGINNVTLKSWYPIPLTREILDSICKPDAHPRQVGATLPLNGHRSTRDATGTKTLSGSAPSYHGPRRQQTPGKQTDSGRNALPSQPQHAQAQTTPRLNLVLLLAAACLSGWEASRRHFYNIYIHDPEEDPVRRSRLTAATFRLDIVTCTSSPKIFLYGSGKPSGNLAGPWPRG
jgi:hypothetical protein